MSKTDTVRLSFRILESDMGYLKKKARLLGLTATRLVSESVMRIVAEEKMKSRSRKTANKSARMRRKSSMRARATWRWTTKSLARR